MVFCVYIAQLQTNNYASRQSQVFHFIRKKLQSFSELGWATKNQHVMSWAICWRGATVLRMFFIYCCFIVKSILCSRILTSQTEVMCKLGCIKCPLNLKKYARVPVPISFLFLLLKKDVYQNFMMF